MKDAWLSERTTNARWKEHTLCNETVHTIRDSVPMHLEGSTILALERATGQISHKGKERLTRSPNWCTISWSRKPQKSHLKVRGHAWCLDLSCCTLQCRSSRIEKTVVGAAFKLCVTLKKVSPKNGGQLFNTDSTGR